MLKTGFKNLDSLIKGMRKGKMIVLASYTSIGKSAFALNVATNLAKSGKSIYFVNKEMTAQEFIIRQISSVAMIDSRNLRNHKLNDAQKKSLKIAEELRNLNFWTNNSIDIDIDEILKRCKQKKCEKEGLDFVVIDCLQTFSMPNALNEEKQKIEANKIIKK
jgi:replicative DNA helicase